MTSNPDLSSCWIRWWRAADESSFAWTVVVLVAVLALRAVVMSINIDGLTTIDAGMSAISRISMIIGAIVTSVFAARSWFGSAPDVQYRMPLGRMRRDRVGVWLLCGVLWISIAGLVFAWEIAEALGVGAQYLAGPIESVRGAVISNGPVSTPRTVCSQRVLIRKEDGKALAICLSTKFRASLSSVTLTPGEVVTVQMKVTPLGSVALSVEAAPN